MYKHLTSSGWLSSRQPEHPAGAFETWQRCLPQRTDWSRDEWVVTRIWFDPRISEAERDMLKQKFGRPFTGPLT